MTKNQSPSGSVSHTKATKNFKSFSHELGPKGGIPPAHPRVHSYGDLKVLFSTLRKLYLLEILNHSISRKRKLSSKLKN